MGLGGLAGGQALAQVGAQAAQLSYAGDDAGLFGEGWEGNQVATKCLANKMFDRRACEMLIQIAGL